MSEPEVAVPVEEMLEGSKQALISLVRRAKISQENALDVAGLLRCVAAVRNDLPAIITGIEKAQAAAHLLHAELTNGESWNPVLYGRWDG